MDKYSLVLRLRLERVRRELARRNYAAYLSLVHGPGWIPTRFSAFLARAVQSFLEADTGNAYDILVLETPPQHGKSMTVTETLPGWILMRRPDTRIILASYNEESAERFSRRNREKLQRWGRILFGVEPGGVNRATEFEIKDSKTDALCRGRLISRGILSGITGHPANLLIIDDPVKNREEADSPAYREKLWGEWLSSLKSRLAAKAKVIVIMTPWHEDDLAARILKTEENIRLVRLPVEAEEGDPMGRSPGDPLCPELGKDRAWLEQFRRSYLNDPSGGARAWAALYQCAPRTEGGNLIRRDWWRYYEAPGPDCPVQCVSVDAAFKGGDHNDYVAITVWGKRGEDYYLLDCRNEHLTFTETLAAIRETRRKWPEARAVLIEDKANGSAVIDVLRREMFCIPVEPRGGKETRAQAAAVAIEAGHVCLPRKADWLEAYRNQWAAFPNGAHDDMVDSSTQALSYLFDTLPVPSPPAGERERVEEEEAAIRAMTDGDYGTMDDGVMGYGVMGYGVMGYGVMGYGG